ncbi:MAG: hypothetical protein JRJ23_10765 [Deltaproteobacteria bacterium]|nr:hypothetical protein [Deltaproteobacteria bacterium]MBW1916149.1 hypothetical protein [Deltaproteobacteria bacterium]
MSIEMTDNNWVYVVIEEAGASEKILGQQADGKNSAFIPAFLEKEAAQISLGQFSIDRSKKYEVQAIIYEDLKTYAKSSGLMIFFLNQSGVILDKIMP